MRRLRFGSTTDGSLDQLDAQLDTGNENGNNPDNDLVIRDSTGEIVARYNESATTWQLEQPLDLQSNNVTNVGALDTESLVANNVVVDEDSDLSFHKGDLVDVDSVSTETIFDVTEPVDIVYGTMHGAFTSFVRVEFDDGTTKDVYEGRRRANDSSEDDSFDVAPLPPCKNVVKLEFRNDSGAPRLYGWEVATI